MSSTTPESWAGENPFVIVILIGGGKPVVKPPRHVARLVLTNAVNVNIRGPYLIARAALSLLLKSDLKLLITVSSVGAHVVGPGLSDYQTSKLAVLRSTEFLAAENAEAGLVAISVHPGNMLTDMISDLGDIPPELKAVFTETPELCADSLVYLSSVAKERRQWLSGRYVNVTWDLAELLSPEMEKRIVEKDLLKVKLATPQVYP